MSNWNGCGFENEKQIDRLKADMQQFDGPK